MADKPILDRGESATKFDAENLQTDREKRRDGIPEEDIRKDDWAAEPASHGPAGNRASRTTQRRAGKPGKKGDTPVPAFNLTRDPVRAMGLPEGTAIRGVPG